MVEGDVPQEEWHQGHLMPGGCLFEQCMEGCGVDRAVIRRDSHAKQQNPGTGPLRRVDDRVEIPADVLYRQSAQPVICAKLNDDDLWMMFGQCTRQAGQAS